MAKDLNTSNLGQIVMNGEEIFLGFEGAERTEVLPAGIDGSVVDGVFVATGDLASVASIGRKVKLPKTMRAREAFLKKWAEKAAEKAKANKGLSATLLILPLAACGGGGGDAPAPAAFEVTVAGSNISFANLVDGFIRFVDVTNGTTVVFGSGEGAARQTDAAGQLTAGVTDKTLVVADGQTLEVSIAELQSANVAGVTVTGAGNVRVTASDAQLLANNSILVKVNLTDSDLTFDLPSDDNDLLVLLAGSSIDLNGGTLIIDDGIVDARLATIAPGAVDGVVLNSKLIVTVDQFIALGGAVSTEGTGEIEIVALDAADVTALQQYLAGAGSGALSDPDC